MCAVSAREGEKRRSQAKESCFLFAIYLQQDDVSCVRHRQGGGGVQTLRSPDGGATLKIPWSGWCLEEGRSAGKLRYL